MSPRPFRFGIQVRSADSRREWVDTARRAEAVGFSSLLVPDHIEGQLAPIPALMAAAAVTSNLRIGSLVLANDFRHPVLLAKEAATLDLLSDGRLELGIGAGWNPVDYKQLGIPCDDPQTRVRRLEENIVLLRRLLDGDEVTNDRFCEPVAVTLSPEPAGTVPIMVGGGARRVLGVAGRHADIVGVTFDMRSGPAAAAMASATANRTDEKLTWLKDAAGARFDSIELQLLIPITSITDSASAVIDAIATGSQLDTEDVASMPPVLVGSVPTAVDALIERRERFGFSYIVFADDVIEAVAPIVEELAGR